MGYIVMSAPLRKEAPEWFAPLAYGKDREIAPDQLLRRGGRATMFATPAAANTAIRDTIAKARADGDKWPDKYGIYLLTVEDAPPNALAQASGAGRKEETTGGCTASPGALGYGADNYGDRHVFCRLDEAQQDIHGDTKTAELLLADYRHMPCGIQGWRTKRA